MPSANPRLAPWTVTAFRLTIERALEVLCACVGKETVAPGVIVGKDLAFWAAAMRFAGALVARQQFIPALTKEGEPFYRARWAPILAGDDALRLGHLAKAMPAACRALTRASDAPPQVAPLSLLRQFVGQVVDHLVRSSAELAAFETRRKRRMKARDFASLHDQWLHALRSPHGLMVDRDEAEVEQFAAEVCEWQRPLAATAHAPFRLCLRLEEPGRGDAAPAGAAGTDGVWVVRYLLRATDDPSLLIPAEEAWRARGRTAALLKRDGFDVREYLLSALGQASGLCPRIEASLRTATPGGYELDAGGAYDFLTEKGPALEQAGFGVLLPAWWARTGTKLRLSARAHAKAPAVTAGASLSLDEIVRLDWELALGGERISLDELEELARLKAPLVRVRGRWVQVNAEEIQAALDFWKRRGEDSATARDVLQMALGAIKPGVPVAFDSVTAGGWVGDLLAQLDGRSGFEELAAPHGFQGTLRPYQVRGYSWLTFLRRWGLGACLADDMGLGKTIQTLALVAREWGTNGKRPVLLICPTSVVGNWQKEAARFTPGLPVMVHHGIARSKGEAFQRKAAKHAIVVSSYSLLHRDFEILKEVPWSGVVLDEAQNVKNPETKQSRAARALPADFRIALTGTPVENSIGDLWAIMEFLNPGLLGAQAEFKRIFFIPIQANRDVEAAERLKLLTQPFILRRLKTDKAVIADLPEKMEMKVFCTLTREQASLYAAVAEDAAKAIESAEGINRKGLVLATLSKLKQVCNHPAQFLGDNSPIAGRSGKLARLTEMLEEILAVGDRALVFTQFAEMGAMLRKHLQETFGRDVLFLHGGVPKRQRDRMVERFQDDDEAPRVFVLSLKAGGTGLNLTGANHVFHFDRWWNPAVEDQATDRAFRIGQTRNVQVHKFLCAGTLEEKIDDMIERKKEVAAEVIGAGEAWLTELSTAELKQLFALSKEAVAE